MSIESLFIDPDIMLEPPLGWKKLNWSRSNQTRLQETFSISNPPSIVAPRFIIQVFEHALQYFPKKHMNFRLTQEYLQTGQAPTSKVIGAHSDGYPFFLVCNNNPTYVEKNNELVQLKPGEVFFMHAQHVHEAPPPTDQDYLRVRLKVGIDW